MQTFLTYLPVIKDIVTILATATAAIVAVIGLQTWRKQIRGNAEYNLARRVLVAVYKVRDASVQVRFSFLSEDNRSHEKCIAELDDAERSLEIELLEAEAVWGDEPEFPNIFRKLSGLVNRTRIEFGVSARNKGNAIDVPILNKESYYNKETELAVKTIENYLRPKLKMEQGMRR